jgi:hypothetical protein
MPCVASHASTWILERFVLEAGDWKSHGASIFDQTLSISGDEVCHWTTLPEMAMEPQAAIHRVNHPLASQRKLTIGTIVERAVTVDRSAAHSRTAAMSGSVAGDSPLEGCRRERSSGPEIYSALLGAE